MSTPEFDGTEDGLDLRVNGDIPLNLDVTALRKQKLWLINQSRCPEVEGLLGLLDAIQDWLVDVHGIPERAVFELNEGY